MENQDYSQPTDTFVRSINIHTLLPQQEPFVMIGQLEHYDAVNVSTTTEILPENIFVVGNVMTASGLIENIAQTCAARIGYINKYILKKGIQIGFIGAIKNLEINELPPVGATITTNVTVLEEVFGMLLATAQIFVEGKRIASAEMKIAIKE